MSNNIYEHIAKQLNDHKDQSHGVKQGSYTTWNLDHIKGAVQCALDYLYSINPKSFPTTITTITQPEDSCSIRFDSIDCKVLEVIRVGDKTCSNVTDQTEDNAVNMMSMLNTRCLTDGDKQTQNYSVRSLADDTYLADSIIPKGTLVEVLCSKPKTLDTLSDNFISEHSYIICNFALWQLLIIDNESRTNPLRWEAYFNGVKWFVETKLLLEFSLKEDDYFLGRRKVDDK